MTYSQILFAASQEQRRLALEYRRDGRLPEFKFFWKASKRLINRAITERKTEQQWKMGVAA